MLAKRFFVSKYYLCRAFKRHNGISVHGYVNQKRVMYAKQLIEAGETASGAAYRVGFGDYSAFYRAYVKQLGVAPTMAAERKDDGISDS
jgi:AraC-like DNA-binding protein